MYKAAKYLILSSTLAALSVPPAMAQEMTADDILKRLQAQRTRTLSFVTESTPEDEQEAGVTATAVPAETDDTTQVSVDAPTIGDDAGELQLELAGEESSSGPVFDPVLNPKINAPVLSAAAVPTDLDQPMDSTLTIDLTIYFDFDSAVLQTKSKTQLNALCQAIQLDTGNGRYQIIGHTDASGSASYNQQLSQARADEVVRYMVGDCGISETRLDAVGLGENRLKDMVDPNSSDNRRVEVQVLS